MDNASPCGAPTTRGKPCSWPWAKCPVGTHRRWRRDHGLPESTATRASQPSTRSTRSDSPAVQASGDLEPGDAPGPIALPAAIMARDPLALQWWVIERIIDGALQPPQAAAISGVVRTLAGLPPGTADEAATLACIALRGQLMHGIPPRSPGQWDLAATMFDDDALAEFRRWALLEDDGGDVREPFAFGDCVAGDGDMPAVIHHEDGG